MVILPIASGLCFDAEVSVTTLRTELAIHIPIQTFDLLGQTADKQILH